MPSGHISSFSLPAGRPSDTTTVVSRPARSFRSRRDASAFERDARFERFFAMTTLFISFAFDASAADARTRQKMLTDRRQLSCRIYVLLPFQAAEPLPKVYGRRQMLEIYLTTFAATISRIPRIRVAISFRQSRLPPPFSLLASIAVTRYRSRPELAASK